MVKYLFGIDIGGTSVKIGLFNLNGALLKKWDLATNKEKLGEHILDDIYKSIISQIPNLEEVKGYGFGVPGPVVDSKIIKCVNLGWKNYDLISIFSKLVNNNNIIVKNDANVAALGETLYGAAIGFEHSVMITLGTGVGGGVIINGNIVDGAHGAAGEIGHIRVIKENGSRCNCGNYGCLETVAGSNGIKNLYNELEEHSNIPSLLKGKEHLSVKMIINAAKNGDLLAEEVVEKFTFHIGYVCSVLSVVTNPDIIIIGGGISNAGIYLLNKIDHYFRKMIFEPVKKTKLVLAKLGNNAGIYGAVSLVKNNR